MRTLKTKSLGILTYAERDLVYFPLGLAGFEDQKRFLVVSRPESEPFRFLQSVDCGDLFFIAIPVQCVDPGYELLLIDEYQEILHSGEDSLPNYTTLAIVSFQDGASPTANLLGPIVISPASGIGLQAIRDDLRYSATHPLFAVGASCS